MRERRREHYYHRHHPSYSIPRSGFGDPPRGFSAGYTGGSRTSSSAGAQESNERQQAKEKEAYEKRMKEFGARLSLTLTLRFLILTLTPIEEEIKREEAEQARARQLARQTEKARGQARTVALSAARKGDLAALREVFETEDVEVDKPAGARNERLLHAAARSGNLEVVKFLVEKGVFVCIWGQRTVD